jgi:hypothetical protein
MHNRDANESTWEFRRLDPPPGPKPPGPDTGTWEMP